MEIGKYIQKLKPKFPAGNFAFGALIRAQFEFS